MVDVMQAWLGSGQNAIMDSIVLLPRPTAALSLVPLETRSGQASVFYLIDDHGGGWILKRFLPTKQPDPEYIEAIQSLVPSRPGLESGFGRRILISSSVSTSAYCNPDFQSWINGTILMSLIPFPTWAELADSIRSGTAVLSRIERLFLCRKLSEKIEWLESAGIAHRDLSSTNIMIDATNVDVHLIDWDSLYHLTLTKSVF